MRVRDRCVDVRPARLFRDAVHHACPIFIPRRQSSMFFFGVANRVHHHILSLRLLDRAHHVVRTGIIFSIAEQQQRPPPIFPRQLFRHRIVDGVVKRRSQISVFRWPQFRKHRVLLLILPFVLPLILRHPLNDFRSRRRKIADQPDMVPKRHEKCPILWPQHFLQEYFQVLLVLLCKMVLASAHIHDQPQRQRNVRALRKKRDLLWRRVLEYLNVFLCEALHQRSARIPHRERHVHQIYRNMNRLLTERQPATQIHQQGTKQRHTSATRWPPPLFHEIPLRTQSPLNWPSYPYRRLVLPRTPTERGCPPHSAGSPQHAASPSFPL